MKLEKNWEGEESLKIFDSSSLNVSQSVIQLSASRLMQWSSCVLRYASSWPV